MTSRDSREKGPKSPNSVLSSHLPVRVKKRLIDMQGFREFISVIS